jgi:chemotaxis protein histidine kinase CheA
MPRIHERAREGKMLVVPVLVGPCKWHDYALLADRQMVPNGNPLIKYTLNEAQWEDVKFEILEGLREQVKRIRDAATLKQAEEAREAARRKTEQENEAARKTAAEVAQKSAAERLSQEVAEQAARNETEAHQQREMEERTQREADERTAHAESARFVSEAEPQPAAETNRSSDARPKKTWWKRRVLLWSGFALSIALAAIAVLIAVLIVPGQKLSQQKQPRTLHGHTSSVTSVAFSPDGQTLASSSTDHTIKLWAAASGQSVRTLQGHTDAVNSVAFSPDGRTVASGSYDQTIKLWDAATRQNLRTLQDHTGGVNSVAFSPDGRTLASGSADSTIKLWDVTNIH